jgi:hypothetical protein
MLFSERAGASSEDCSDILRQLHQVDGFISHFHHQKRAGNFQRAFQSLAEFLFIGANQELISQTNIPKLARKRAHATFAELSQIVHLAANFPVMTGTDPFKQEFSQLEELEKDRAVAARAIEAMGDLYRFYNPAGSFWDAGVNGMIPLTDRLRKELALQLYQKAEAYYQAIADSETDLKRLRKKIAIFAHPVQPRQNKNLPRPRF